MTDLADVSTVLKTATKLNALPLNTEVPLSDGALKVFVTVKDRNIILKKLRKDRTVELEYTCYRWNGSLKVNYRADHAFISDGAFRLDLMIR